MRFAEIKQFEQYFIAIQRGEAEINHFWFFHAEKMLSWFWIWYDADEWPKISNTFKVINYVLVHLAILLWTLVAIRCYQDYSELSPSRLAESLGTLVGGVTIYMAFWQCALNRQAITQIIQVVDRKCLAVPKDSPRFKRLWLETKRIYKLEGKIMMGILVTSLALVLSQFLFTVVTGTLFYESVVIVSDKSYSWPWWLQNIYQEGVAVYSSVFTGIINFIAWNLLYQIHCLLKVQACTIMELCQHKKYDPKKEYAKLRGALTETLELYEISGELKRLVSPLVFIFGTTFFVIFSAGGVALIVESRNGWFSAISKTIAYPAYCLAVLLTWIICAEKFTEGVEAVQDALYNCNWVDAPFEIRKLILTYKILLGRPNNIEALPFAVLNKELLTDICKRTYYFLAVLSDILNQ